MRMYFRAVKAGKIKQTKRKSVHEFFRQNGANDGYLAGEHFTCPICGKEAEVYSRITGYYRPVQNWNDGKLQEFKERKVYDITKSHLKVRTEAAKEIIAEENVSVEETKTLLFTTKTCPNCKVAGFMLDQAHVEYEKIDAEESMDLVEKYGVRQAPTLIVLGKDGIKKLTNTSEIKKYTEEM